MNSRTIEGWFKSKNLKLAKLHLGCGSVLYDGWCNVDFYPGEEVDTHRGGYVMPDVWCDIRELTTADCTVDVIKTVHVLEHFYKFETIQILQEFYRVMKPGSIMIHEMPNFKALLWLSFLPKIKKYNDIRGADKDVISSQFYGASWEANPKGYPYHKYVWSLDEFVQLAKSVGFDVLLASGAVRSHMPLRDFAVVCKKPGQSNSDNDFERSVLNEYGGYIYRGLRQIKSLLKIMAIV